MGFNLEVKTPENGHVIIYIEPLTLLKVKSTYMRIPGEIQHAMHIKKLLWVLLVVLVFTSSVSAQKSLGIRFPSHFGLSYQKNILPFIAFGQTETDFTKLIRETNYCLTQYAKLSPFGDEYYPISDFGLSKKEIKELLLDAVDDAILSNSKDSIQQHFMIEYFQRKIEKNINQIVKHPDFRKVNIRELIKSDELSIVVSEDNKLFNFSFDEKTGGTYRSQLSITHYTDFAPQDPVQLSKFNSFFSSDGYNGIYTLNTNEGTKYVLTGFVRGCSSCFETSVRLIVFKDGEFKEDFMYSVMSRDWNDGVSYDHETKTIIVDYHTDDLTPFCSCTGEIDDDEFNVDGVADHAFSIHCRCRFVFNGSTFVRSSISECIRAKAEPIVIKSVFSNTSFKLNADSLSAVETIELENGDKVRIENTGCEYYVLTFRIETTRFQGAIDDIPFWYDKAFLLMTDLARGIDAPIQINKGLQYLKSYMDENIELELGKEIDFGGEDIRDILTIHRTLKLTDELFAIELSFATGPL